MGNQLQMFNQKIKMNELVADQLRQLHGPCFKSCGKIFIASSIEKETSELTEQVATKKAEAFAIQKELTKAENSGKEAEKNFNSLIAKLKREGTIQ